MSVSNNPLKLLYDYVIWHKIQKIEFLQNNVIFVNFTSLGDFPLVWTNSDTSTHIRMLISLDFISIFIDNLTGPYTDGGHNPAFEILQWKS